MKATTVTGYKTAKSDLDHFIDTDSSRDYLKTWVAWWHEGRGYIFRAFAPNDPPAMNQAEVIHAGWAKRDMPKLSLLDASHADIRDSLLLETEVKAFKSGSTTSGRGPSFANHLNKKHCRENKRHNALARKCFQRPKTRRVY